MRGVLSLALPVAALLVAFFGQGSQRTFGLPHPVALKPAGVAYPKQADPDVTVGSDGAVYVSFLAYGFRRGHTDV